MGEGKRLRVTGQLTSARKSVKNASKDVSDLREKLSSSYFDYRSQMGRSEDLETVDPRYESVMKSVDSLSAALDSYSEVLHEIRKNYRELQEAAIVRAMQIPK